MEVRRGATLKDGDQIVGNRTKVKVVKNKVAAPFKEVEIDLLHGYGFSREGDLLDLGAANNVVEKSGSWFSFGGERIGQGRDNARQFLREHPEMAKKIDSAVRAKLGIGVVEPVAAAG
jgi:recombination protein RecA